MSQVTRCPACGTMFKVVPDQLKISDGWVRCGQCSDVFDATAQLQDQEPMAALEAPVDLLADTPVDTPVDAPVKLPDIDPPDRPFVLLRPDAGDAASASGGAELEPPAVPKPKPELAPEPAGTLAPARVPAEEPGLGSESQPEHSPALEDVSFVRQARREGFWQGSTVRVLALALSLALGALLVLQWALHDRDLLVATRPALRPWLELLCGAPACTIGPPRQIEAIVVDSSSFTKLRSDAYRLNFSLRNQASIAVAMPSIELTLTDTQDQPVVRRVLTPADLGARPTALGAASEWSGTLALGVAGGAVRVAGYRLLAFYP